MLLMLHNSAQVLLPLGDFLGLPVPASPKHFGQSQPSLAISTCPVCSALAAVCPRQELQETKSLSIISFLRGEQEGVAE